MKYLIFLLLFSCNTEPENIVIKQQSVPTELMGLKASEMIVLTNQYRDSLGLQPSKTSMVLYNIAVQRNNEMIASGYISHLGFTNGANQANATYYGESISFNYNTAQDNITGFYNSQQHWQMFVSPIYEYIAVDCDNGYTTVLFAKW